MANAANRLTPKAVVILYTDVVGSTVLVQLNEALAQEPTPVRAGEYIRRRP